jgi:hypothetical protein
MVKIKRMIHALLKRNTQKQFMKNDSEKKGKKQKLLVLKFTSQGGRRLSVFA